MRSALPDHKAPCRALWSAVMGFRDDIRRLKELQQANPDRSSRELQQMLDSEKQAATDSEYTDHFAPTAVETYVDTVTPKKRAGSGLDAMVKNYIRIVGLAPEDVFGMYGDQDGERSTLRFVYRDRPEYQEGRRRFRQVMDE